MKTAYSIILLYSGFLITANAIEILPLNYSPGLVVTEYPRNEKQDGTGPSNYVKPEDLGESIGNRYLVPSLSGWKYETTRNAVAKGMLKVNKAGEYHFMTDSYYDRNVLKIAGETVCSHRDGGTAVGTINLEAGLTAIESIGYVDARGSTLGIVVKWKPPGQREFSEIPPELLLHTPIAGVDFRKTDVEQVKKVEDQSLRARWLTVVAKDFVIETYKNGKRIPDSDRKLLLDRFGATAEQINTELKAGDWLVFHVAHNRLRHKGSKFFAVAGSLDEENFGFVSNPKSENWSVCDSPVLSAEFIRHREMGTESRAMKIERPWEEGMKFMKKYTGRDFPGEGVWGTAPSTWIKYTVPEVPEPIKGLPKPQITIEEKPEPEKKKPLDPDDPDLAILNPKRWPVQVVSANYGTGGKNADVTTIVKDLVEVKPRFFAANPGHLKADPNPYWNKSLHIVYMKDGVRREQRRNENEHILPESFYGPQDSGELRRWLIGTRWQGPKGEVQFHPNSLLTGPGLKGNADWKVDSATQLKIIWPGEKAAEFRFDYTWSSFRIPSDAANNYRIMK
ncbi:MAG: hypothetical protein P1U89_12770 [Verrucomicrobiales bacterium]|nr:hypothetical protein [Verrucomicrobiales bacterium]